MFVNWFWLVLGFAVSSDYAGFSKGKSAKDLRQAVWNKQWENVPTKMFVGMLKVSAPPSWSDNKQEGLRLERWRCEQNIKLPSCCSRRHEVVKCPFCIASLKFISDWNIFMWWCRLPPSFFPCCIPQPEWSCLSACFNSKSWGAAILPQRLWPMLWV